MEKIFRRQRTEIGGGLFDLARGVILFSARTLQNEHFKRGKLRLTDPVENYIPGFKNWESKEGKTKRTIRISHLMTHTSGLPAYAPVAELQKR